MRVRHFALSVLVLLVVRPLAAAQACGCATAALGVPQEVTKARPRPAGEGEGPFEKLILRGVTVIDGTGAPPRGPMDVVVEGNRIVDLRSVGSPGLAIEESRRPKYDQSKTKILELDGHYVLPGFIDMHGHIGGASQGADADYVFKLWMGHGITTIRDPACGNGLDWTIEHRDRSAKNEITAPRIHAYPVFGQGHDGPLTSPKSAEDWVHSIKARGADGIKFFGYRPDVMEAAIRSAARLGLRTACHHAQMDVTRVNALTSLRWGLTTMEHWYGLPEALFVDRRVQDYPPDYNYNDEQHRFAEAGRLWKQAAPQGSERWNAVMSEMLERDFTIDPTFNIYEASRDLLRLRCAEWHRDYTLPSLWDYFRPNRDAHGSYWFDWGTEEEVAWRENYRVWMAFVNEFKNRGGRVTTGSDSGFIYQTYGFGYVRELELLREAGFHPLEVVRSATLSGAEALGVADQVGSIEVGKLADFVILDENPLRNLKVLYGTGVIRLDEANKPVRRGGVVYTIKDGLVFDARALLADVRARVAKAWTDAGRTLEQPGY